MTIKTAASSTILGRVANQKCFKAALEANKSFVVSAYKTPHDELRYSDAFFIGLKGKTVHRKIKSKYTKYVIRVIPKQRIN